MSAPGTAHGWKVTVGGIPGAKWQDGCVHIRASDEGTACCGKTCGTTGVIVLADRGFPVGLRGRMSESLWNEFIDDIEEQGAANRQPYCYPRRMAK